MRPEFFADAELAAPDFGPAGGFGGFAAVGGGFGTGQDFGGVAGVGAAAPGWSAVPYDPGFERPSTTEQYDRRVVQWLAFNEIGFDGWPYDPTVASSAKWRLNDCLCQYARARPYIPYCTHRDNVILQCVHPFLAPPTSVPYKSKFSQAFTSKVFKFSVW